MAGDLGLEDLSYRCCVATDHADIVEQKTCNVDNAREPVPVASLDEEFADDDVHDEGEGDAAGEPVRLSQTF